MVWIDAELQAALAVAWDYMRFTHPPVEADAILALGSFDPEVATCAAGLWKAGFAPLCVSAWKKGSDSHLVDVELIGANNARLKEIELPSAIHLAFDELQLCDLTLGLSV